MRHLISLFALAAGLCHVIPASAHDFSSSYSKIIVEGQRVRAVFTLNLPDLHNGPKVDWDGDGQTSPDELDRSFESIFAAVKANYHVEAPEPPTNIAVARREFVADNLLQMELVYTFDHPVKNLKISSTLDKLTQPDHTHILQIGEGDDTREGILNATYPSVDIPVGGRTFLETFWDLVRLGVQHIFTGYDHLAFLVGLLVMTTTLFSLVKVVTSFTVAHSLTLALAAFQIVSLPPQLIESLIALSIAYIAMENFTGRTLIHRWKITFLFGLVHGFGFSNVLREMALTRRTLVISLFSFNAGVEVGQLIFVCIVFPMVYYAASSRWKEQFLATTSLIIMSLGVYWFVQRAFLT